MNNIQEILAKSSWNEKDIEILLKNVGTLPISALQRLGLAPVTSAPVVKEPVKAKEVPPEPVKEPEVPATKPKPVRKARRI